MKKILKAIGYIVCVIGLLLIITPPGRAVAAGVRYCFQYGDCTLNSLTILTGGSITAPTGNFDNLKWGAADGGSLVVQGDISGTNVLATTRVGGAIIDGGILALSSAGIQQDGDFQAAVAALGNNSGVVGQSALWLSAGNAGSPSSSNYALSLFGNILSVNANNTGDLRLQAGATTYATVNSSGLTIGTSGGSAISKSFSCSRDFDFGSVAVTVCEDTTITCTGVAPNADLTSPQPNRDAGITVGNIFTAWVQGTNLLGLRHCCVGSATCDPLDAGYSVRYFNP